ncbi:hypothetical protein ACQP1W_28245 [Spirillospora sp. CA-255316]
MKVASIDRLRDRSGRRPADPVPRVPGGGPGKAPKPPAPPPQPPSWFRGARLRIEGPVTDAERPGTRLPDVAGCEEVKQEIREAVFDGHAVHETAGHALNERRAS